MINNFEEISHTFLKKELKEVQAAMADYQNHEWLFDENQVPEKTRLGYNKKETKEAQASANMLPTLIVVFGLTTSCATLYLFWRVFTSARSSDVESNTTSMIKLKEKGEKTVYKDDQPLLDWDIIFFMLLLLGVLSLGYKMILKPKK